MSEEKSEKEIIRLSVTIGYLFFTRCSVKTLLSKKEVVRMLASLAQMVFDEMNATHVDMTDFDEVEKVTKELLFENYKIKI